MPRTRSRPRTEEKFEQAVLDLVAREGCCALGVNAVAQKAGADKVLIYRYFGDLNGLLLRVAESRSWLPSAADVLRSLKPEGKDSATVLHEVYRLLVHHIRADRTTHQLVCWRKADKNPLTNYFTGEWRSLWRELPERLSVNLTFKQREAWKQACAMTGLVIEADLCEENVAVECLDRIAANLELGDIKLEDTSEVAGYQSDADALPTNLL